MPATRPRHVRQNQFLQSRNSVQEFHRLPGLGEWSLGNLGGRHVHRAGPAFNLRETAFSHWPQIDSQAARDDAKLNLQLDLPTERFDPILRGLGGAEIVIVPTVLATSTGRVARILREAMDSLSVALDQLYKRIGHAKMCTSPTVPCRIARSSHQSIDPRRRWEAISCGATVWKMQKAQALATYVEGAESLNVQQKPQLLVR